MQPVQVSLEGRMQGTVNNMAWSDGTMKKAKQTFGAGSYGFKFSDRFDGGILHIKPDSEEKSIFKLTRTLDSRASDIWCALPCIHVEW